MLFEVRRCALRLIDRGFRLVADDRVALVRRGAHLYAGLPCSALPAGLLVELAERYDFDARALAAGEPGGGADAVRRR